MNEVLTFLTTSTADSLKMADEEKTLPDLPNIKEGLVGQKQENNVKDECENENPESPGIGLIVAAEDRPEHSDIDAETMMGTFKDLEFVTIVDDNVDCENLLALVKGVADFYYSTYYKFFAFYYTGYGGCDSNGRVYLILGDERVYLDWIVFLFSKRKYKQLPCMIFVQLYVKDSDVEEPLPLIMLPNYNNIVVAISGLDNASIGRDTNGGIWTQCLCHNINKYDLPITIILDLTQHQLPPTVSPQYVASTGLMYLKQPLRLRDTADQCFRSTLSSSPDISGMGATGLTGATPVTGKVDVLRKRPRPEDVKVLLNDVGDKWLEIGQALQISDWTLKNVGPITKPGQRLVRMTSKKAHLTWAMLITAVRNAAGSSKADAIIKSLEKPEIYSKY